jgi:transposase
MHTTAATPATTPIPVQLSETEFSVFILPHLSMPKRGPKCTLGSDRVFNLLLWGLYTGRQWKCLPVPTDSRGTPALHDTTGYNVFAQWAEDGARWRAFVARVRHLAAEKRLDRRMLHGDGTNTGANKGAMAVVSQGTNPSRARRSLPSLTIRARCERPSPWRPSMRPTGCCCRRACQR